MYSLPALYIYCVKTGLNEAVLYLSIRNGILSRMLEQLSWAEDGEAGTLMEISQSKTQEVSIYLGLSWLEVVSLTSPVENIDREESVRKG